MAKTFSAELQGPLNTSPPTAAKGSVVGGRVRRYRATITLAAQVAADTIVVAVPKKGDAFMYGVLNSTVTLGTSTIAIGITGTTGKYRTAATFTVTNTPTFFGNNAAVAETAGLTADEEVFITVATATLPGSGTLVVDMYFSNG